MGYPSTCIQDGDRHISICDEIILIKQAYLLHEQKKKHLIDPGAREDGGK